MTGAIIKALPSQLLWANWHTSRWIMSFLVVSKLRPFAKLIRLQPWARIFFEVLIDMLLLSDLFSVYIQQQYCCIISHPAWYSVAIWSEGAACELR